MIIRPAVLLCLWIQCCVALTDNEAIIEYFVSSFENAIPWDTGRPFKRKMLLGPDELPIARKLMTLEVNEDCRVVEKYLKSDEPIASPPASSDSAGAAASNSSLADSSSSSSSSSVETSDDDDHDSIHKFAAAAAAEEDNSNNNLSNKEQALERQKQKTSKKSASEDRANREEMNHLVVVPHGDWMEYPDPDTMTLEELIVALGFTENHEMILTQHRRRMEMIDLFTEKDFEFLATRLGCSNPEGAKCFGRVMMMRKRDREQPHASLRLFADDDSFAELGHEEVKRHCSDCRNQPTCLFGGFGGGDECVHKLQRFVDWLDIPQYGNFQWHGRRQLSQLLKHRMKQRQDDITLTLRWNLCHPDVHSITYLIPDNDAANVPNFVHEISHPKLTIKKIFPQVTFASAVKELTAMSRDKGTHGIIARWDTVLGHGFNNMKKDLPAHVALALTSHEAFKGPGLGGISPLEYCKDDIGGDHIAFVIPLPPPKSLKFFSEIGTTLHMGETGFVNAMCASHLDVENPCMDHYAFHVSRVKQLRPFQHKGVDSEFYMGEAKSCKSGDSGSACCSRNKKSKLDPTSWEAIMENPVWKSMSGLDDPFDAFAMGFAEPDMLPFTQAVQTFLYRHQHPKDCSTARFSSLGGSISGIGSLLHDMTVAMSRAIDDNRIFVAENNFLFAEKGSFCNDTKTIDCFVAPMTDCTLEEARKSIMGNPGDRRSNWLHLTDPRLHVGPPKVLEEWLRQKNIRIPSYNWWRAQALLYLLRFNGRTRNELITMRRAAWENGVVITPKTISMNVRYGGKSSELPQVPLADFLQAAASYSVSRNLFVTTEEQNVIDDVARLAHPWKPMWNQQDRMNQGLDLKAGRGDLEFLLEMLNMLIAIECDTWIGARESNWARIVDEMKSTRAGKAKYPYIEIGNHSFGN